MGSGPPASTTTREVQIDVQHSVLEKHGSPMLRHGIAAASGPGPIGSKRASCAGGTPESALGGRVTGPQAQIANAKSPTHEAIAAIGVVLLIIRTSRARERCRGGGRIAPGSFAIGNSYVLVVARGVPWILCSRTRIGVTAPHQRSMHTSATMAATTPP